MGQEPWPEPEIKQFVTESWPQLNAVLFSKINVNGKETHPVYTFLKKALPGDINWNFASKFIIGRDGIPVQRFDSKQSWDDIEQCIKSELDKEYKVDDTENVVEQIADLSIAPTPEKLEKVVSDSTDLPSPSDAQNDDAADNEDGSDAAENDE